MNVLLTGATGFIGSRLAARLADAGHDVRPVSRRPGARHDWSDASLARGVREADAVIHLAGENLFGRRWTAARKRLLWSSRCDSTKTLAALVVTRPTMRFISASAIGYYGAHPEAAFHEGSPRGRGFIADLCGDWEAATAAATAAGARTAIVRIGVVLGPDGGALAKMLPPFKLGLGGPLGDGRQWVSWIHIDDLTSLFCFLLEHPQASGVFNGTAPEPVTMSQLARALGRALHRPAIVPVPAPVLRVALGEVADILLTGQKVEPRRTREIGFEFRFSQIEPALRDLVAPRSGSTRSHAGAG